MWERSGATPTAEQDGNGWAAWAIAPIGAAEATLGTWAEGGKCQFQFQASRGKSFSGDIAIDEVMVVEDSRFGLGFAGSLTPSPEAGPSPVATTPAPTATPAPPSGPDGLLGGPGGTGTGGTTPPPFQPPTITRNYL